VEKRSPSPGNEERPSGSAAVVRTVREPAHGGAAGRQLTVLVAEDDGNVRAVVTDTLRRHGYCVLVARDGDEALALASQEDLQIDCVVTDQVMPGATGRDLADQLRVRWHRIPVLLFSGFEVDAEDLERHFGSRVLFLRKPFSPTALLGGVSQLVGTL
jgi:CheY-like chemotaxis protein